MHIPQNIVSNWEVFAIEGNKIEITGTDIVVNKTLMHILDELMPEYREQVKMVILKKYILNKKEICFVKELNNKDIIEKYLTKLDFNFLSDLSEVFDFLDNDY